MARMTSSPGQMLVGGCEVTEWELAISGGATFGGVMGWDDAAPLLGVEVPVVASGHCEFRGSGFLKSVEKLCDGLALVEGVASGPFRVGRATLHAATRGG